MLQLNIHIDFAGALASSRFVKLMFLKPTKARSVGTLKQRFSGCRRYATKKLSPSFAGTGVNKTHYVFYFY